MVNSLPQMRKSTTHQIHSKMKSKRVKVFPLLMISLVIMCPFSVFAKSATVNRLNVNFREQANISSDIITQFEKDAIVEILDESNSEWIKVKYENKTGYVFRQYISESKAKEVNPDKERKTGTQKDSDEDPQIKDDKNNQEKAIRLAVVKSKILNVREAPSLDGNILNQLDLGTAIGVIEVDGDWAKVKVDGIVGYVWKEYIDIKQEILSRSQQFLTPGLRIVELAKRYLGIKYTLGGANPKTGFDCSGLVYYIYRNFIGYQISRVAQDQAKHGIAVERKNLQPGDLVFFWDKGFKFIGHVGIYVGNGEMIHAPQSGSVIQYCGLDKYSEHYHSARRINAYPKF